MNKKRTVLASLFRSVLMGIFLYTGMDKLLNVSVFELQLRQSAFLFPYSHIISRTLPVIECTAAFSLLFKVSRRAGLYTLLFLLSGFTAYIYALLHSAQSIPCSCGGIIAALSWKQHFVFNVILILVTIVLIFSDSYRSIKNIFSREESGDTENLQNRVSNHQNSLS